MTGRPFLRRRSNNDDCIALLWENFGPMHVARCEAVAESCGPNVSVVGLELHSDSDVYEWEHPDSDIYEKVTLETGTDIKPWMMRAWRIISEVRARRPSVLLLCHYERPEILAAAAFCRLSGIKTVVMSNSKFDDFPRSSWREAVKSLWFVPYRAALTSEGRSRDYLQFHGFDDADIYVPYNTVDTTRFRPAAQRGKPPPDAAYLIVARLVAKKNISMALDAYAIYRCSGGKRPLKIAGYGELLKILKAQVDRLALSPFVTFLGPQSTSEVATQMKKAFALVLPSLEEQFGNVVIEAQAAGLPVIVTDAVGARDSLVRASINGFVVEPDNPAGLAYFMQRLDSEDSWCKMSVEALNTSLQGDVAAFGEAVRQIMIA